MFFRCDVGNYLILAKQQEMNQILELKIVAVMLENDLQEIVKQLDTVCV